MPDVTRPHNDPYALIGENWPAESESAYHTAKIVADDSSVTASTQAQSARDAEARMADEHGQTAGAVSGGYGSTERELSEQSITYTTISAWMADAGGKVGGAKKHIASLVLAGTSEIRDAITSEVTGTPVSPSSAELTSQYRNDIASVASKLSTDLDAIGHSLHGDSGSSTTPAYVSVLASPTVEVAAFNHGDQPEVAPQQLPPMPRATSAPSSPELPSTPGTPSAPSAPTHAMNPTLANLISGSGPSGSSTAPSGTGSPHTSSSGTAPAGTAAQSPAHHAPEHSKPAGLPNIPSIPLPDLPAAAETITTSITSAVSGHQLPTSGVPATPTVPASTGFTPGTSGPVPMAPAGLAPIGGLPTPPSVVQAPPVAQGAPTPSSPAAPAPAQSPAPAPPRGPAADLGWLQRTYGLSPGLDLPKSETAQAPALFIADLPEPEAHLHLVLATLRQVFEVAGWSQPITAATIRKGFETRTVFCTADAVSIHPAGVLLPDEVLPIYEMHGTPAVSEFSGSLMVTDKLRSLIPREWAIEHMLSTVPTDEQFQSAEQFQELVTTGERLECSVSRGNGHVTVDDAMSVFARAAIRSRGCGDLDSESARLQAARWIGVQPAGYLDVLSRWYLADAAESMGLGRWGDAVYSAEKYMSVQQSKAQAA